jgi:hypothetical protein
VFELFTRPEYGHAMSTHRYNFTGFGISGSFSAFSGSDFKCSESTQLDNFVVFQTILNFFKEFVYDIMDIFSIDTQLFVDAFDDFRFGQFAACQDPTFHCLRLLPGVIVYSPWSEFNILWSRDFFLEAVFLGYTPLFAAESINLVTSANLPCAPSVSFASTASRKLRFTV